MTLSKYKILACETVAHDDYGLRHSVECPAVIAYNIDGTVEYERYYIHGRILTKELWEVHPLVIAALIDRRICEDKK